jgi:ABC-type nitrate/sulfonate/bicarbonate transport system permease component
MSRRARFLALALEVLVPAAAVGLLALWSANKGSYYYPPLTDVLSAFRDTWLFARVGSDVLPSLARMGLGLGIAVLTGVALGLVLGRSRRARLAATPVLEFVRAIPAPALLPFAIVAFGVGTGMKVFIIALGCVWPILLNTIDGAAGVDPTLEETSRAYGFSGRDRVLRVVLPAAGPQIFAGIRSAVSLALILMVVSEMVASTNGIGYFVLQSQRTFAIADMWSGVLLLGLLGYALNGATVLIERRLLRWHRGARAGALR